MGKKLFIYLLLIFTILNLTSCSLFNKETEEEKLQNYLSSIDTLPDSYEFSILKDLYISKDVMDETSKEIADYIIKKSTISITELKGNKATINIKTKNIYNYLNTDYFLKDYKEASDETIKTNLSINEYNNFVYGFLKNKIDSQETEYTTKRISISFTKNDKEYKLTKESEKMLYDAILCRDEIIENQIAEKTKPYNFLEIDFEISSDNKMENIDIDKPREKEYNKNEIFIKNNKYKIPEDLEYQSIPNYNDTTRTSRRSAIKIGEVAVFDGNGLQNKQYDYKVNILINDIFTGDKARQLLKDNNENINNNKNYIILFITLKLKENNTGNETVSFFFTDFDLINYEGYKYGYMCLENLKQFDNISKDELTTGYVAFEYDGAENVNLAFKEYLDNTIWFNID